MRLTGERGVPPRGCPSGPSRSRTSSAPSSVVGRRQTLLRALLSMPLMVLKSATLHSPSGPGYSWTARPSFQFSGEVFSSLKTTRSPTCRSRFRRRHLLRCWSSLRYSSRHLDQKCRLSSSSSSYRLGCRGDGGEGKEVIGLPIKKCPGVKGERSLGSGERGTRGRELKIFG